MSHIQARRMNYHCPEAPNWLEVQAEQFLQAQNVPTVLGVLGLEKIVEVVHKAAPDSEMVVVTFKEQQ